MEKVIDVSKGRVEAVASVAAKSLGTFLLAVERGDDSFEILYLGGKPFAAEGRSSGGSLRGMDAFKAAMLLEEASCRVYKLSVSEVLERIRGKEAFKNLPSQYLDLSKLIRDFESKPAVIMVEAGDSETIAVSDGHSGIHVIRGISLYEALRQPAAITYYNILDPQKLVLPAKPPEWPAYRAKIPVFTSPRRAREAIDSELGDRRRVLEAIDGKSTCEEIALKANVREETVAEVISEYETKGLIKLRRRLPTLRPI